MAKVYANLIIRGRKTISEVPVELRDEVRELLIEKGYPELTEEN